jgi:iron complex outermembrane recepter protein
MKVSDTTVQVSLVAVSLLMGVGSATAQEAAEADKSAPQEVVVTGSRIYQTEAQREQPLSTISTEAIEKTGLADVGSLLQQLTTGGQALNTKFNSSGNFGYPPDGGGIGAGSAQVSLRNLDSKRVLVLVDGIRWVNESSASGVSGSADLNTIPVAMIDHMEVLEDGASAIYGSDAIAGVVNIITKRKFEGVEVSGYTGDYGKGGQTTEGSVTIGGTSDKFAGMMTAEYYKQNAISSSAWWQSATPEPYAGLKAGSSATPQGRYTFCDPTRPTTGVGGCDSQGNNWYDLTLNNGTTSPVWNPNDPSTGTYHNWSNADRFNYAPYNLLLTPQTRKSIFTNMTYTVNDYVEAYVKGMYNTRDSENQAAPEPIFVGPFTGSGGLADTISIAANNPYNPFGVALDASSNLGWVTRRPLEAGPRIFTQTVDTLYFGGGFRGKFGLMNTDYHWDLNFADSENRAQQTFSGGYNLGSLSEALGDPAICATIPNCVPLDLFGGQGRPITQQQLAFIEATQHDASTQDLKVVSANITGNPFSIQDRPVGIAVGGEHRQYIGKFNPDPLRTLGLSQDSFASPVDATYHVNEGYAEVSAPVLPTLGASGAVRFSDYSNFGSTTTYKLGMRWQPIDDFGIRGTYSTGFRAPNIGELYGLTQFAPTLVDPCGPTTGAVVTPGNNSALAQACRAQGVPNGFVQANTQITTFTGGNPKLQPEKSDSYTVGILYNASWAEDLFWTGKMNLEVTYYHDLIKGAIQAQDLQALLAACINQGGGTDPTLCAPFTRASSGNLNPPKNFLANLGHIQTDGEDLKFNWASKPLPFGRLSTNVMVTRVNHYSAIDQFGDVAQRTVGVEVNNSSIPRYRLNATIGYGIEDLQFSWTVRYLSAVKEACSNAAITGPGVGPCTGTTSAVVSTQFNTLKATTYNDLSVAYTDAFSLKGLSVVGGVNNLFGVNPPVCLSCTLNGYDAGSYDLPGAFWNVRVKYKF